MRTIYKALALILFTAMPVLAAPGSFTLSGSSGPCNGTSPAVVSLTWTASAGATSYTIYRENQSIATVSGATTGYDDHGVISGTFGYFVRASDGAATTDSNSIQVNVPDCVPPPGAFTVSGNETCHITQTTREPAVHVSWTASANATSYDVYHNGSLELSRQRLTSFDQWGSEFVAGRTHTYYIVANGSGAATTQSNTISITITNNACPTPPPPPVVSGSASCDTTTNPAHAIVTLNWGASTGATGYQILRNGASYASASGTTYTDQNVTGGTSYTYVVRATNNGGSADSNTVNVNVPANVCGAPPAAFTLSGNVNCVSGAGGAHLSWTASAGATSYTVYRNNTAIAGPISATSYDDSGVTVGQTYTYRVAAANASGTTSSNNVDILISGNGCGAPANFVISASAFCTSGAPPAPAVHVSWTTASGATSYVVNRNGIAVSAILSASATSFDDTSVAASQTYSYTVTATNGAGSTPSNIASATTASSCASGPGAFTVTAFAICAGVTPSPAVRVTWSGSANATAYFVHRDGVQISGTLPSSATSYDDTNVAPNQSYTYTITAENIAGTRNAPPVSITTAATCATAPSTPSLSSQTTCSGSPSAPLVHLTWTGGTGATSFTVYRNGVSFSGLLSGSTTSFDDPSAVAGQTYAYFVRAANAAGSRDSNTADVAIAAGTCQTPPSPFSLAASAVCDRSTTPIPAVRLTWSSASGATSYAIVRDSVQLATVSSSTLAYIDTANINAGQSYGYVVRAIGGGGSTSSNGVNVTPSAGLCAGAADLVASNAHVSVTSALPGDNVSLSFEIVNQGDGSAGASTTRVRFGTTAATAVTVAILPTASLAAGASTPLTTSFTAPAVATGTYFVFISVDDDQLVNDRDRSNNVSRAASIRIGSASCAYDCSAVVPTIAVAGQTVAFQLATPPSCTGATVTWSFGDGQTSNVEAPSHVYAAGVYIWSVTINAGGTSCQSSGTIAVPAPGAPRRRRNAGH
jgi:fibronectin type 3 domain-containing protein